jgi:phospholipid/cholesterol/gamma-HCH transport system ATP-binding protein
MAVTIAREIVALKQRIHVTSIVVTHDRDLAFSVADRIAIISAGTIRLVGTPDEVRASRDPVVQSFLHAEFHSNDPTTLVS